MKKKNSGKELLQKLGTLMALALLQSEVRAGELG